MGIVLETHSLVIEEESVMSGSTGFICRKCVYVHLKHTRLPEKSCCDQQKQLFSICPVSVAESQITCR